MDKIHAQFLKRTNEMNKNFWQEIESLAISSAAAVSTTLLQAYLSKETGAAPAGTPALTLSNIGTISGVVAASTVLQHLAAAQAPAVEPATPPAV